MSVKLVVDSVTINRKVISESLMLAGGHLKSSDVSNGSEPRPKEVCKSSRPMLNHTLRPISWSKAEEAFGLSGRPHASAIRTANARSVQVDAAPPMQRKPAYYPD